MIEIAMIPPGQDPTVDNKPKTPRIIYSCVHMEVLLKPTEPLFEEWKLGCQSCL
jgi:hypothetical protein